MSHWVTVSESQYPWEQEALDFIRQRVPASSPLHFWSNFEFVADAGSIYEVDLLVLGPWGAFLVEIKSRPGVVSGGGNTWTWTTDGRQYSDDNPVLLANRKCKAIASFLGQQKAFNSAKVPFVEAVVFCSHDSNKLFLRGPDAHRVTLRDREPDSAVPGILGALTHRRCPGLKPFDHPPIKTPQIRAFLRAMEQAGIRPRQSARRAGDYRLETLFFDSPTQNYQDWIGRHATVESGPRLIRLYLEHRQSSEEERNTIRRAAEREYQILSRLDHAGILRVETLTATEMAQALVFRGEDGVKRLDHYLAEHGPSLDLGQRLELLRQIADAVAYAHRKRIVHRALSPQSVLVCPEKDTGRPLIRIYNWQVGLIQSDTPQGRITRISRSLHASQLLEDGTAVYMAPEAVSGQEFEGEELDAFSLGALAFFIFSGQPPAATVWEMNEKLRSNSAGLNLREVLNGATDELVELVQLSANANRALRYSASDFLLQLEAVEELLTAPSPDEVVDPRQAKANDRLGSGLTARRKLGSGGISQVLLVETTTGEAQVLKVANRPENNRRLREEFDVLKGLRSSNIVEAYDFHEFGVVHGFTMARAGDETLAQRLRKDGKLEIDLLERFGEQLLEVVDELDSKGIAHRDIKPDNLGVRTSPLRLVLFDFSLTSSRPDDIRLGTPPYLDPFLELRKVRRWDAYAERFSAAVTLYEMATGGLPRWGDGSAPHVISAEVTLEAELFPPQIRDQMTAFFEKALRRNYQERFDNAEEMRKAWRDIFRLVDEPAIRPTPAHDGEEGIREDLIASATPHTQLILLGLSARLTNALDRLGLVTIAELLAYPLIRIHRMRGVGNKTRQELADLVHQLRTRFPLNRPSDEENLRSATEVEIELPFEVASIDLLAKQVALSGGSKSADREQQIIQAFLGLHAVEGDPTSSRWPSQTEFAEGRDVTRARIGQVVTKARERWVKVGALTSLREAIFEILKAQAGVMTHEELIAAVLHLRGSALPDPDRYRMASVVTRAALEAERHLQSPRFHEVRRQGKIFITPASELAEYAMRLGIVADRLVREEPLPTSARSIEELQGVASPDFDAHACVAPDASRLVQLAAGASRNACSNVRLELYPRGMKAKRALLLAQSALFGARKLTVEQLRQSIASRYKEAEPLPGRPELDALLEAINFPLKWSADAADGVGAYVPPSRGHSKLSSLTPSLPRMRTANAPVPRPEVAPEIAEAQRLEEKLLYAEKQGSFLVLAMPTRHTRRALTELESRFAVEPVDGDRLFLEALKAEAEKLKVNWDVVLAADAEEKGSRDWDRLQMLVRKAMPAIRSRLQNSRKSILLVNPGLFARYGQLDFFQEIRTQVGTGHGPHGFWILVPSHGQTSKPTLNGEAIPIVNPAQFEVLNEAWLMNEHRGRSDAGYAASGGRNQAPGVIRP